MHGIGEHVLLFADPNERRSDQRRLAQIEGRCRLLHGSLRLREPLLLVHGRFERIKENRNIIVDTLESLGPLARKLASSDVGA